MDVLIEVTRDLGLHVKHLAEGLTKNGERSNRNLYSDDEAEPHNHRGKKPYTGPVRQKHLELKVS